MYTVKIFSCLFLVRFSHNLFLLILLRKTGFASLEFSRKYVPHLHSLSTFISGRRLLTSRVHTRRLDLVWYPVPANRGAYQMMFCPFPVAPKDGRRSNLRNCVMF